MSEKSKAPIFLLGPTAVGKTTLAIKLARKINGEIVSADSMQLYKGMDIGTAKPSMEDREGVPHHLFDVLDIQEHCDVVRFQKLADTAIKEIHLRDSTPIIVGGSGMYVRALTQGIFEGPGRNEKLREDLDARETKDLREELILVDPIAASKIGENDRKRMTRALEFFKLTGKPISEFQNQWKKAVQTNSDSAARLFCLNRSREELYNRCDRRVDSMFANGFVDEVRSLMKRGLERSPTASKAIGYSDVIRHIQNEAGLPETIEKVKQRTRNFVKRQLSWFRREPGLRWIDLTLEKSEESVISEVEAFL
jgi:tRNA dimethylallyltransferase